MKAVTKIHLYLSKEEVAKIETMIDDIEDFLIEMEKQGISNNHLVEAQNKLHQFLDESEALDDEE